MLKSLKPWREYCGASRSSRASVPDRIDSCGILHRTSVILYRILSAYYLAGMRGFRAMDRSSRARQRAREDRQPRHWQHIAVGAGGSAFMRGGGAVNSSFSWLHVYCPMQIAGYNAAAISASVPAQPLWRCRPGVFKVTPSPLPCPQ